MLIASYQSDSVSKQWCIILLVKCAVAYRNQIVKHWLSTLAGNNKRPKGPKVLTSILFYPFYPISLCTQNICCKCINMQDNYVAMQFVNINMYNKYVNMA